MLAQTVTYTQGSQIVINHAGNSKFEIRGDTVIKRLNGNIRIYHNETFFFCDSAIIIGDNIIDAFGNISMIQHDSIKIFCNILHYNADSMQAILRGKVLLKNGDKQLYTSVLYYDTKNKIATYNTGAKLKQKKSTLSSRIGKYRVEDNIMKFYKDVTIDDPQFSLRTDSISYDTKNRICYYIAPTVIKMDSSVIYCETGTYDIKYGNASFEKNMSYRKGDASATGDKLQYSESTQTYTLSGLAKYKDKKSEAKADVIYKNEKTKQITLEGNATYINEEQYANGEKLIYDESDQAFVSVGRSTIKDKAITLVADKTNYSSKTENGSAQGRVEFQDTSSRIIMYSISNDFDKSKDYMFAYGDSIYRLQLITYNDEDSTYITSDTLYSTRIVKGTDTTKIMKSYNGVRIFNKNYQAVSDSLVYFRDDSLYVLYGNPVIWSEDKQISGDTITIWLKNSKLDKIYVRKNAMIVNSIVGKLYNQIKGSKITIIFENDSLKTMKVDGNAQSIYHMQDDKKELLGTVETEGSYIDFDFKKNKISNIFYYIDPHSKLTPVKSEISNPHRLDGFQWYEDIRPFDKTDILRRIKITPPVKQSKKSENNKNQAENKNKK